MITKKKIKELALWNKKAHARNEAGVFLAEGIKMFMEAPIQMIREIYVSESFFATASDVYIQKLKQLHYETVSDDVFGKISDTRTPQGILCVMERMQYSCKDMLQKENPVILILEDLQDPGNLGTILRTGEGAGIGGIILSRGCVDIYNPKTIRSTMGSIYRVPFLYTDHLQETILDLKKRGVCVYAAHLNADRCYDEFTYMKEGGISFLIGNEGNGLTKETADLADHFVKIPMSGKVESLNAAVASSILMYEAYRQIRGKNSAKEKICMT